MQWIKIPLVLAAILFLVVLFRHRQRVELRAGGRVIAMMLALVAVASIIDPDIPQGLANLLGVARGTDLLLYLLIVVFVLTTLGLYFRLKETDQHLRRLVRSIAIEDAIAKDGPPGQQPTAVRGSAMPRGPVAGAAPVGEPSSSASQPTPSDLTDD